MSKLGKKKQADLTDRLKQFYGIPPHNTPDNDHRWDEIFFQLIVDDYSEANIVRTGRELKREWPEYF